MFVIIRKAVRIPLEIFTIPATITRAHYPRQWLKIGLFSLLLSGLFSMIIVVARTPGIAELIGDPVFARKSLVLHVDFALVVWFYAFLASLYLSLAGKAISFLYGTGIKLAIAGVFLMIIPLFIHDAEPVLANYIPVLDHPLFLLGLLLLAASFVTTFLRSGKNDIDDTPIYRPSFYSENASLAIRYGGLIVVIASFTFVVSFIITPAGLYRNTFYELVMWGGGHILQFANVFGMITVWLILLKKLTGREILAQNTNRWLTAALAVPALASPLLMIQGTTSQLYYSGFTELMRWFIFPVVTIYMIIGFKGVWNYGRQSTSIRSLFSSVYFNGFLVSVLLTITGFVLGAMIRGSSTLIPAHYHASLGGVTVAYMVMVFILMKEFGYSLEKTKKNRRLINLQPILFGFGQTIFVIGFAYAGLKGMGRKLFGQDQSIHTVEAMIGLGLMSIGGLLAMAGGLLFIYIVYKSYKNGKKQ